MEDSVYNSPSSYLIVSIRKREKLGKILSIIGCFFQCFIIYGFFEFLITGYDVFKELSLNSTGNLDFLIDGASSALAYQMIFCILALPGLVFNSIALIISSYRSEYINLFLLISSIVWILCFPLGSVLGVIFLVVVVSKRKNILDN